MENLQDESLEPNKLPQNEVFIKKEVFQQKQPADTGKPMAAETDKKNNEDASGNNLKEEEKSSKEEGLNQERSAGDAGAFEGFEKQEKGV